MANYPELKGKVAIVTGAGRGIGAAIAKAFGAQGCRVAINDIESNQATDTLCYEIDSAGGEAKFFAANVRHATEAQGLIDKAKTAWGRIDYLINNAGITRDHVIWKMADQDWDDVIAVNLTGCFNTMRAIAPLLREQQAGRIVNISSINGLRGNFGQANYAASKAGIIGLTKSVARELGRSGVTVNAIAPGLITTEMSNAIPDEAKRDSLRDTVLERFGTPEDIANTVLFLCSEGARHITGEVIKVDGGQYI